MKPGGWLPRLQKCPSCRCQTVVVLTGKTFAGGKVVYRRHTGSGEWPENCDLR